MNKAKTFNRLFPNVTYRANEIDRHVDHKIKKLSTDKILLTTPQMRLAISNSTNNNSNETDSINIRHLKHLGPLAIRYLTSLYKTALNTNTIPHLGKRATIIPFFNQKTLARTTDPYHFYHPC